MYTKEAFSCILARGAADGLRDKLLEVKNFTEYKCVIVSCGTASVLRILSDGVEAGPVKSLAGWKRADDVTYNFYECDLVSYRLPQ